MAAGKPGPRMETVDSSKAGELASAAEAIAKLLRSFQGIAGKGDPSEIEFVISKAEDRLRYLDGWATRMHRKLEDAQIIEKRRKAALAIARTSGSKKTHKK